MRTELKAGKFISTGFPLVSASGLGKQSFSDSKNAFVPVVPHVKSQMTSTFWVCSVRLFPVPSWPETGSGLLRVPCPYNYTRGKLLETDLRCLNATRKDQLRKEAGEMETYSNPSLTRHFQCIILKPHYQTQGHFAHGFQILPPTHIPMLMRLLTSYHNTCV